MRNPVVVVCLTLTMSVLAVGCQPQSDESQSHVTAQDNGKDSSAAAEVGAVLSTPTFPVATLTPSISFNSTPIPIPPTATPMSPSWTPEPSSTLYPTETPIKTDTRVPTKTLVPSTKTPTRRPTATLVPPTPTEACFGTVAAQFRAVYPQLQSRLGCPKELINTTYFAYQKFADGRLMWRGMEIDDQRVHPSTEGAVVVLYSDSSWEIVQFAKYDENRDPQYPCAELRLRSPSLTPKRGFGKLLCTFPTVYSRLGKAISPEQGDVTSFVQFFDGGFLVHYQDFEWGGWFTIAFYYGQGEKSGIWEFQ